MAENFFSQKLKIFLRERKITQKMLSEMLGTAQPTISNLINGRDDFGKATAFRWAEALNIDPLWLMSKGEQGMPPDESELPVPIQSPSKDVIMQPILNLDMRGGLLLPNDEADIAQFVVGFMPFSRSVSREGDVVVPVVGDSMAPRYPSGSFILIRPLERWREWLELGQSYVLELADWRRVIKIIRKGSDESLFRLDSYNVDFDTTEIKKTFIERVWQVIMSVKKEVM